MLHLQPQGKKIATCSLLGNKWLKQKNPRLSTEIRQYILCSLSFIGISYHKPMICQGLFTIIFKVCISGNLLTQAYLLFWGLTFRQVFKQQLTNLEMEVSFSFAFLMIKFFNPLVNRMVKNSVFLERCCIMLECQHTFLKMSKIYLVYLENIPLPVVDWR